MLRYPSLIALLLTTSSLSCSGDDGSSCTIVQNNDGAATISCDDGSEFTLGNGSDGTDGTDGIDGIDGSDGAEALAITSAEAAGANCPDGGQRIDIGLDNGDGGGTANNGTLEAGEIDSTYFSCDGSDGFTSLLTSIDEAAGANCPSGGQRIDVGLDNGDGSGIANNGTLEAGEVDSTFFLCDGADGTDGFTSLLTSTDEAAGANCTDGGQRIDSGLDNGDGAGIANNGLLEAGEIDETSYVCNGVATPRVVGSFAGSPGPDLSASGFSQCGGIAAADVGSVLGADFYSLCGGYSEIIFACSTDDDLTPEFTSSPFPVGGVDLVDNTCDDWVGAANSIFGADFILAVDASDPGCNTFSVSFDMYAHFGTQWGCAGTANTHNTGGRMWAYVR